eukprot:2234245-Amphidinium_carterae.1
MAQCCDLPNVIQNQQSLHCAQCQLPLQELVKAEEEPLHHVQQRTFRMQQYNAVQNHSLKTPDSSNDNNFLYAFNPTKQPRHYVTQRLHFGTRLTIWTQSKEITGVSDCNCNIIPT